MSKIELSIMNDGFSFETLLKSLYQRIDVATVRELTRNALDAHQVAGVERKVDFKLDEDVFYLRDYGHGISQEDMHSLVSVIMKSSKRGDASTTGGHGLGSKTPFGLLIGTDHRGIMNSIHDGYKTTYEMSLDENGMPSYDIIAEGETDEPSGVSYFIPVSECMQTLSPHEYAKLFYPMRGLVNFIGFDYCSLLHVDEYEDFDTVFLKTTTFEERTYSRPVFLSDDIINGYDPRKGNNEKGYGSITRELSKSILPSFISFQCPLVDERMNYARSKFNHSRQMNRRGNQRDCVSLGTMNGALGKLFSQPCVYASIDGLVYSIDGTCVNDFEFISDWERAIARDTFSRIMIDNLTLPWDKQIHPIFWKNQQFVVTVIIKLDKWDGIQATRSRDRIEANGTHGQLTQSIERVIYRSPIKDTDAFDLSETFITYIGRIMKYHLKSFYVMMASVLQYVVEHKLIDSVDDRIAFLSRREQYFYSLLIKTINELSDEQTVPKLGGGEYTKTELTTLLVTISATMSECYSMMRHGKHPTLSITYEELFADTDVSGSDIVLRLQNIDEYLGCDSDNYVKLMVMNTDYVLFPKWDYDFSRGGIIQGIHSILINANPVVRPSADLYAFKVFKLSPSKTLNENSTVVFKPTDKVMLLVADMQVNKRKVETVLKERGFDVVVVLKTVNSLGRLVNAEKDIDLSKARLSENDGIIEAMVVGGCKLVKASEALNFKIDNPKTPKGAIRIPGIPSVDARPSNIWVTGKRVVDNPTYADIVRAIDKSDSCYAYNVSISHETTTQMSPHETITERLNGSNLDFVTTINMSTFFKHYSMDTTSHTHHMTLMDDVLVIRYNNDTSKSMVKFIESHEKIQDGNALIARIKSKGETVIHEDLDKDNTPMCLTTMVPFIEARSMMCDALHENPNRFNIYAVTNSPMKAEFVYAVVLGNMTGVNMVYDIPEQHHGINLSVMTRRLAKLYHTDHNKYLQLFATLQQLSCEVEKKMEKLLADDPGSLRLLEYAAEAFARTIDVDYRRNRKTLTKELMIEEIDAIFSKLY